MSKKHRRTQEQEQVWLLYMPHMPWEIGERAPKVSKKVRKRARVLGRGVRGKDVRVMQETAGGHVIPVDDIPPDGTVWASDMTDLPETPEYADNARRRDYVYGTRKVHVLEGTPVVREMTDEEQGAFYAQQYGRIKRLFGE